MPGKAKTKAKSGHAISGLRLKGHVGEKATLVLQAKADDKIDAQTQIRVAGTDRGGTQFEWVGAYLSDMPAHATTGPGAKSSRAVFVELTCTKGKAAPKSKAKPRLEGTMDCIVVDITITNIDTVEAEPMEPIEDIFIVEP